MAIDFNYKVQKEFDRVIDEKGNTSIMMRKVAWGDSDTYKLEVRKWHIKDNKEVPSKGVTFMTEEGPSNLANAIIDQGYGKTEDYLHTLKKREDFEESLANVIGKKAVTKAKETEVEAEEYYDPREFIV